MENFEKERTGTGTREWSDFSHNIQTGCKNNCAYCYARHNIIKRFKTMDTIEQWTNPILNENSINKSFGKVDGVIMFPTQHDISRDNVEASILTLKNMLKAGNEVLIVSKPDYQVIVKLCDALTEYKNKILFRFTIGTSDDLILEIIEPGAPSFHDRLDSLKHAYKSGYKTSVSCEPLLGGYETLYKLLMYINPYVTNDIWVGKMNKIKDRVLEYDDKLSAAIEFVKYFQSNYEIMRIYNLYKKNTKIKWKDSYMKVINEKISYDTQRKNNED